MDRKQLKGVAGVDDPASFHDPLPVIVFRMTRGRIAQDLYV